ncbi:MAG: insulinase family protein [Rhodothermales bacterium]|nr:insulinase family protein [Rhodothermales bacterium]
MGIAGRTTRTTAGPVDLAVLPTGIQDVVTIRGSVDTDPGSPASELVQDWMVRTLDRGSQSRDRFEIASILENLGAQVGFSGSGSRIRMSARCLRKDLPTVVELLFEQLCRPALDSPELAKSRDRLAASIQRGIADAGYRANVALSQAVYNPLHPNYIPLPAEEDRALREATEGDARAAHAHLLKGRPRLVIVGDVDPDACVDLVARASGDWAGQERGPVMPPGKKQKPVTETVEIADRDNLEVRWGHALDITRMDDDFLPAYLASFILGGNFSARLMNEIREKRGLTYGIGSGLRGIDSRYPGMWRIQVTLSQENLEYGIDATEAVVREFADGGVTDEELADKKTTLAGSFKVRLATTAGLAGALLQQMEDGRDLSWVDSYPARVEGCSLESVNEVIGRRFDPAQLSRIVAGTLPKPVGA